MAINGVGRIAVIGTGTIGASWAAFFLARGLIVAASDPAPEAEGVSAPLRRRSLADPRPDGAPAAVPEHALSFYAEPEAAVAGAEFVQESAPERAPLKRRLLQRIDAVLPPPVVIASSSSGLLISELQADCGHPERCVIGHPFNPPHLMPLVEVVGGAQTAPDSIERAMAVYASLGKRPIHIRREVKGHIANRLQAALWRRPSTSSRKASSASRTSTPRSARGRGCAGR